MGAFCLIWCLLDEPRHNLAILRRSPIRIVIMGLLVVPAYNLLLNWGQGQVPAGTASLLIAMNPVFTYILALLIRQEHHRRRKTLGLLIAFIGVYLLLRDQGREFGPGYGLRALSVLGAPASWAIATVIGKPLVARESPIRVTYLSLALGSIPFLIIAPFDTAFRTKIGGFGPNDWIAQVHLSVLCTILGYAVWYAALRRLPASSVAAFVLLNPPLTIAFGPVWGTDRPTHTVVGYGVWILAGIVVSTWGIPDLMTRAGTKAVDILDPWKRIRRR